MRIYELVFIVKPDLPDDEIEAAVSSVQEAIEGGGGTIDKVDKWGKKRLAYRVKKYADGFYTLIQYRVEEASDLPKEIERRLRVADPVIKFMTIRIDEDLKKLEKARTKREARGAKKPQAASRPAPAAPSAPSSPTPGAPDASDDDDSGSEDKD